MKLTEFKNKLKNAFIASRHILDYIIEAEIDTVKGKGFINAKCFVNVLFNEKNYKIDFALILEDQRIWGIDHNKKEGWHRHPLHNIKIHAPIEPMEIEEIIAELETVLDGVL